MVDEHQDGPVEVLGEVMFQLKILLPLRDLSLRVSEVDVASATTSPDVVLVQRQATLVLSGALLRKLLDQQLWTW